MKFLAILFCLTPLLLHAAPQLIHGNDPMQVTVHKLDNGLTVYLSRNAEAPSFYAEIAVRTGGKNDPSDCTGLAHYLEHLLFKGTQNMGSLDYQKEKPHLDKITALYEEHFNEKDAEKRKALYKKINAEAQAAAKYAVANDIDRIFKFIGGRSVNAHTSMDETTYKVALPTNQFERWAIIESERFSNPVFRLFHTELETVYEEKNQSLDSGADQLWDSMQNAVYPGHPYGTQTVLGETEHLKSPSIKRIRKYFEKYYVPENMAILISGDFPPGEALTIIEKHFGKWKNNPAPKYEPKSPAPLTKHQKVTIQHEGEESLMLAWQTVPINHPDSAALTVMDMLLNNSVAGLIDLNLVKTQRVRSAGSYPHMLNEAGAQYFWASPCEGQTLDQLETLILEQLDILKKGDFAPWIIPAIVTDLEKETQSIYESNNDRVDLLREAFISRQPWSHASQGMTRISAVTKEDVVRVANKFIGKHYVTGHLVSGKASLTHIDKPKIDPVPLNDSASSKFADLVLKTEVEPMKPKFIEEGRDYNKSTGENGVTYYTTFNPSNELYTITWTFPVGSSQSPNLNLAFDLLEKSGTAEHSTEELAEQWYKLATSYEFNVYDNRIEITLSGISSTYPEAIKLFWNWLNEYQPDSKVLGKLVDTYETQRADNMKEPSTILHALARYSRYSKKSTYLTRTSSAEMRKLTTADIQKTLSKLFTYQHDISYVGKLSEPQWRKLTPELEVSSTNPTIVIHPLRKISQPVEIQFIHREMAQAQIWIESHASELNPDSRPMIRLFNDYFDGGMSGIVFQELRESRGLAYSASGYVTRPRWKNDANLVIGSISSQADKADAALTKFIELFDQLPVSETRFTESQDSLLENYRSMRNNFRNVVPTVQTLKRQGLDFNPDKLTYQALPDLTLEQLLSFHSKNIKNQPKRISIIGDRTRINMEALKKIAPVKELTVQDVFTP